MIPRVFHHVWLGGTRLPPRAEDLRSTWRRHHPGWEFRLWNESDLRWLRNHRLFARAGSYSQQSDFARWEIVHRFGGVYLDTDMECLREIDSLIEDCSFFGGMEPSGAVASCIFGAEPHHPFPRRVVASMPIACWAQSDIMHQTGPGLVSEVFQRGGFERRPDVRIYPSWIFNAYGLEASNPDRPASNVPYAVHHAVYSWKGDVPVPARFRDCVPATPYEARVVAGQLAQRLRASLGYRVIRPLRTRLPGHGSWPS